MKGESAEEGEARFFSVGPTVQGQDGHVGYNQCGPPTKLWQTIARFFGAMFFSWSLGWGEGSK